MRGHEEPGIELIAQKSRNNAKTDYCYSEFISGTIFPFLILFNMECTQKFRCLHVEPELDMNYCRDS